MLALFAVAMATTASAQSIVSEQGIALTFLSHRSGYNQIYTSRADGSKPQPFFGGPIVDVPSFDDSYTMFREPHWTRQSPNGKYFASWVYESGEPYSQFQGTSRPMLIVGDIQGSWTRIVNPDCHEEFAWSPNSKQLAFSIFSTANYQGTLQNRPEATEICVSGIDGSKFRCILEKEGKWFVLDWSPDGKRLLLERRTFGKNELPDLFEFRLADSLDARKHGKYDPEWNAKRAQEFLEPLDPRLDGLHLLGARYSPTRSEIAIETCDPKGMYAPNLVADDEIERGRMMRLLGKIHVFDVVAKTHRKIADYEDGIRGPICWSPDGNDIYFSRYLPKDDDREKMSDDKEHGLSIWAVGRDGTNARFVTTGWSPDFPHIAPPGGK
jgi:Tol biopolymer transport system component